MNAFQLQWVILALFTGTYGSEEKEDNFDETPLKKTKFESSTAAKSDEEDATLGHKIAETNLVISVASEVVYDINNLTDVKSETEVNDDEDKILETSKEHKIKFINYETECSITEISTIEVRSEETILQKKTRSDSFTCVAIDREDNATLEVSLKSRDNEHLNNFEDVKNETMTHDDDKKISVSSEENIMKFTDNETELFSITKKETNDSLGAERMDFIFAQNDFKECCENVCTFSSHPDVYSDTTDITVLSLSKEIKGTEPNKDNNDNVGDAEDEFKALNSDKDAENGEESKNPANVKNNENTKEFNYGEDDEIVVEEFKHTENVNDNDNSREFGNGEDDVQVVAETHRQYLYRMLRPDEDHGNGITPKDINSTTSINDHVAYGSSSFQKSKYISCTKSEEKVFEFASIIRRKERHLKRTIIKIDKSKLGCNVDIVDLTDTSNHVLLVDAIAKKRALRFAEVLLVPEVHIPAESITAIAHIQNGSITHYS